MTHSISELTEIKDRDLTSQDIFNAANKPGITEKDKARLLNWVKEFKFWEDYGRVYKYLREASSYKQLVETIREFIEPKKGDIWLDVGCGPITMSRIIWEKEKEIKKIIATDIVLDLARNTLAQFGGSIPVELKYGNLGERLPFPNDFFNGITANLVLTYVFDFEGRIGKEAFIGVMEEMFRVLKPGGHLIWSTPKRNPLFWRNFLAGLPDMFSIKKQIRHRVFGLWIGMRIIRYGLGITSKGRKGIYTFLNPEEYEKILEKIGFRNFRWHKTFAGQAWVNRADKP